MNDLENVWKETVATLFRRSQYLPIGTEYKKRKRRRVETVFGPRFRNGTAKTRRIVPTSRRPSALISRIDPVVKLSMKYHVMKACGGMEVHTHAFSTSALDGGERFHVPAALFPLSHVFRVWMGTQKMSLSLIHEKNVLPLPRFKPRLLGRRNSNPVDTENGLTRHQTSWYSCLHYTRLISLRMDEILSAAEGRLHRSKLQAIQH
jgi:hypothetical protein